MIIQLHFTDVELSQWLAREGFQTEMRDVTEWRSAYHNRCEQNTVSRLHVLVDGRWEPAQAFAEAILKKKLTTI